MEKLTIAEIYVLSRCEGTEIMIEKFVNFSGERHTAENLRKRGFLDDKFARTGNGRRAYRFYNGLIEGTQIPESTIQIEEKELN